MSSKPSYLPTLITKEGLAHLLRLGDVAQTVDRTLLYLGAASRGGWVGSVRQLALAVGEHSGRGRDRRTIGRAVDALVASGRLVIERRGDFAIFRTTASVAPVSLNGPVSRWTRRQRVEARGLHRGGEGTPGWRPGDTTVEAGGHHRGGEGPPPWRPGDTTLIEEEREGAPLRGLPPDLRAMIDAATERLALQASAPRLGTDDIERRKAELREQAKALGVDTRAGSADGPGGDAPSGDHNGTALRASKEEK